MNVNDILNKFIMARIQHEQVSHFGWDLRMYIYVDIGSVSIQATNRLEM